MSEIFSSGEGNEIFSSETRSILFANILSNQLSTRGHAKEKTFPPLADWLIEKSNLSRSIDAVGIVYIPHSTGILDIYSLLKKPLELDNPEQTADLDKDIEAWERLSLSLLNELDIPADFVEPLPSLQDFHRMMNDIATERQGYILSCFKL